MFVERAEVNARSSAHRAVGGTRAPRNRSHASNRLSKLADLHGLSRQGPRYAVWFGREDKLDLQTAAIIREIETLTRV